MIKKSNKKFDAKNNETKVEFHDNEIQADKKTKKTPVNAQKPFVN